MGVQTPIAPSPAKPAVDLSSSRSQVFDHQIRRSGGTDHGFKKVDSGRAELVVSRITTTISIARQGPSAFYLCRRCRPAPHGFPPGANFPPRPLLQLLVHCKR